MNSALFKISVCSLLLTAGVGCSNESKPENSVSGVQEKASPAQQNSKPVAPLVADSKGENQKIERKAVFQQPLNPPFTDPFFPQSKRMPYNAVPSPVTPGNVPAVSIDQIILKGVSGTDGKRFALINRRTFAAGESGTVQTPRGPVNIEVLEVKERSAVIKLEKDPEPKEIYLRPEP